MSRTGQLLSLQRLDERTVALRQEIVAIEAALAGDDELDSRRRRADEAKSDHRSAELAARSAETDLAVARHRSAQLERRLYDGSIRNPQDLLGMQKELLALRPQLDDLEAQLLDRMEATEVADAARVDAEASVAARDAERASQVGPRQARLEAARLELAELAERRLAAVAEIDPADLRIYQRIGAQRQPAVVRLDGDSCGGCHLPLGSHEVRQARQGEVIVQCSRCDRILVG